MEATMSLTQQRAMLARDRSERAAQKRDDDANLIVALLERGTALSDAEQERVTDALTTFGLTHDDFDQATKISESIAELKAAAPTDDAYREAGEQLAQAIKRADAARGALAAAEREEHRLRAVYRGATDARTYAQDEIGKLRRQHQRILRPGEPAVPVASHEPTAPTFQQGTFDRRKQPRPDAHPGWDRDTAPEYPKGWDPYAVSDGSLPGGGTPTL